MTATKCPRCVQVIASEDTLHPDCRRPGELNYEERALLFKFCWDHDVAECLPCGRRYRQHKLAADLCGWRIHLCPRCRTDLTEGMRNHLYACVAVPADVRLRVKAQAAISALRDAIGRRTGT